MIAIGVLAVAGFGSVPGAAAKPRPVLKVAPARPTATTAITVSFKAPKITRSRVHYVAILTVGSTYSPVACISDFPHVALRATRGGTFTAKLNPRIGVAGARRWCNGVAQLEVRRYGPDVQYSPALARRTLPVGTGKADPAPPETGVPVKITVLSGSTLTASAAGRPDRSAQLTGVLRGMIPGRFEPNTDIRVEQISGSLTPQAVFPPDPLCPDTPSPGTFDALPSSQLVLKASGDGIFNLVLNGSAAQLFGCGPAGALSGTTTLPLTGHVGPKGLLEMPEAGAVTGIPLPAGSQGGLAATLVLNVDLSGKG